MRCLPAGAASQSLNTTDLKGRNFLQMFANQLLYWGCVCKDAGSKTVEVIYNDGMGGTLDRALLETFDAKFDEDGLLISPVRVEDYRGNCVHVGTCKSCNRKSVLPDVNNVFLCSIRWYNYKRSDTCMLCQVCPYCLLLHAASRQSSLIILIMFLS